jgi:hypothetical protein
MPATRSLPTPSRELAAAIAGRVAENRKTLRRAGVARFITLFLFALVAGVFWGTWFGLSRSIASISPAAFLEIGWIMIRNLRAPMAILMPAALASGLVVLVKTFRTDARASVTATAVGLLLLASALVITLAGNLPLDNQIRHWTLGTLPENWRAVRNRWEFYHGLRTFLSLMALASMTFSVLVQRKSDGKSAAG